MYNNCVAGQTEESQKDEKVGVSRRFYLGYNKFLLACTVASIDSPLSSQVSHWKNSKKSNLCKIHLSTKMEKVCFSLVYTKDYVLVKILKQLLFSNLIATDKRSIQKRPSMT